MALFSEQELCVICQEDINNKPKHTLTCNHSFHTQCILAWFASPRDHFAEAGNCPICRKVPSWSSNEWPSRCSWRNMEGRVRLLRKLVKKKNNNVPPPIVKAIKKVRSAEKEYKISITNFANFKKEHREIFKQRSKLSSARWTKRKLMVKRKYELAQYDPLTCINLFIS